jgi:hypothetical protein
VIGRKDISLHDGHHGPSDHKQPPNPTVEGETLVGFEAGISTGEGVSTPWDMECLQKTFTYCSSWKTLMKYGVPTLLLIAAVENPLYSWNTVQSVSSNHN